MVNARRSGVMMKVTLAGMLTLTTCDGGSVPGESSSPTGAATSPSSAPAAIGDFDPANFGADSAEVDNSWFPLEPGTHYIWEGHAFEDGERVERRVEFIVTDLTKVIGGVRAVVGWDRDFNDDLMGESELIFYAQDKFGTVWHLGEYVEHWKEKGELDGGRLWIVGDPPGAEAGIGMYADPQVRTGEYSQGFAPPPWFWDDHAEVAAVGRRNCVPVGCYEDVITIKEFEPRFPGIFQLKYYAPGVGNIRVGWKGSKDDERETMVLTVFEKLSPDELADARTRVLEQEHRGYAYARTEPAEQRA
jgi:hypothetical protein